MGNVRVLEDSFGGRMDAVEQPAPLGMLYLQKGWKQIRGFFGFRQIRRLSASYGSFGWLNESKEEMQVYFIPNLKSRDHLFITQMWTVYELVRKSCTRSLLLSKQESRCLLCLSLKHSVSWLFLVLGRLSWGVLVASGTIIVLLEYLHP